MDGMHGMIPTEIYSPDIRYNTAWRVGLNGVCDSWMYNGVTYSYGYHYIIRMRFTFRIKIIAFAERNDKL